MFYHGIHPLFISYKIKQRFFSRGLSFCFLKFKLCRAELQHFLMLLWIFFNKKKIKTISCNWKAMASMSSVIYFDGILVMHTCSNFPIGEGQASQSKCPFNSISSWISLLMESKMAQGLLRCLHNEYEKAFTKLAKLSECKTAFNCVPTQCWNIVRSTQGLSMLSSHIHTHIQKKKKIFSKEWTS